MKPPVSSVLGLGTDIQHPIVLPSDKSIYIYIHTCQPTQLSILITALNVSSIASPHATSYTTTTQT
jgi:hypothetical protein